VIAVPVRVPPHVLQSGDDGSSVDVRQSVDELLDRPTAGGRTKSFSDAVVRAWLEAAGRVFCSLARNARARAS